MFSGLTNQVSNWMGKKGEDGTTDLPAEEKAIMSPGGPPAEASDLLDPDKKDTTSPTKAGGGKLEMLAGVKSQMTGWLSGGIPGLGARSANEQSTNSGEASDSQITAAAAGETNDGFASSRDSIQASGPDNVKDDDASSATGGADSGPASLEGTPTDDKDGTQPFGGVSTKALAGAKSLGGFLYSAVNKAGKTVVEASAKIKKTVEENILLEETVRTRIIAELNKEQEAFIAGKQNEKGEAVAPWVGAPNEEALREECLALSTDRRNFVRAPPPGVEFAWDFEAVQPMAQATLALDPNLENMRFELVPKVISEENFWRNYFYRVSLLRQSHELDAMASQAENNPNPALTSTGGGGGGSIDHTQVEAENADATGQMLKNSEKRKDSSSHEFVSDSLKATDTEIEDARQSMKRIGMLNTKEEDWEGELEAELKDFEVVPGQQQHHHHHRHQDKTANGKDDWEQQMDELLGEHDDLK